MLWCTNPNTATHMMDITPAFRNAKRIYFMLKLVVFIVSSNLKYGCKGTKKTSKQC